MSLRVVFATIEEHEEEAGEMLYYLEIVIVVWFGIEFFVRKYLDWPSHRWYVIPANLPCAENWLQATYSCIYLSNEEDAKLVGIMLIICAENIQESRYKIQRSINDIARLWSAGCRSRFQGWLGRLNFMKSPFCLIDVITVRKVIVGKGL